MNESEHIIWKSPRASDGYAEYSDREFLDLLHIKLDNRPLETFWPSRGGPQWDALALTEGGKIVLVEAKSHINEIDSPRTVAKYRSLNLINSSLLETRVALHIKSETDWSKCCYQYANRLAFLYLLRILNELPAYLVNIYFVNDKAQKGPKSEEGWSGALKFQKKHLGIKRNIISPYIADIFINVD